MPGEIQRPIPDISRPAFAFHIDALHPIICIALVRSVTLGWPRSQRKSPYYPRRGQCNPDLAMKTVLCNFDSLMCEYISDGI